MTMGWIVQTGGAGLAPLAVARQSADELGVDIDALANFVDATGPLAFVDLETTGLADDPAAEILEFGAVLIDPAVRVVTTVEGLVKPSGSVPLTISYLTGLTDSDVLEAPPIDEVAKAICLFDDDVGIFIHPLAF